MRGQLHHEGKDREAPCAGAVLSLAQTHRGRPQTTSIGSVLTIIPLIGIVGKLCLLASYLLLLLGWKKVTADAAPAIEAPTAE